MAEENPDVSNWQGQTLPNGRIIFGGTFSPEHFRQLLGFPLSQTTAPEPPFLNVPSYIPHTFFRDLINEINGAFSNNLFTSTYVCLRKLYENLIIEILRSNYGTSEIDLYYWSDKGRFQDFSVLIENIEQKEPDLRMHTTGLNQTFFDFIKRFRRRANARAHSIDIIQDPSDLNREQQVINQSVELLCEAIRRIRTPSQ